MGSHRVYRDRRYEFGKQLLTLRTRASLTQIELAEQIGVHRRSVQNWETGDSYPKAEALQRLIAVLVSRRVFTMGNERAEAEGLWQLASQDAPRPLALFDAAWFAGLVAAEQTGPTPHTSMASPAGAPDSALPVGLVTFLATDIEGSTQRWEQAPHAMQRALARHHAITRQLAARYRGQVLHVAGDSFICVYVEAAEALQCALAIQQALLAEPWPEPVAPLRVRMALHSGIATSGPDGYVAEPILNRLSRVLGASQGRQILLTQATLDLIGAAWPAGVTRRDLGLTQLRDVKVPIQLWQVLAPDVPATAPPQASRPHTPHSAPLQVPSLHSSASDPVAPVIDWGEAVDVLALYGRDAELAALSAWALDDRCRVIGLLGLGGIGKTSLAIGFARQAAEHFDALVFRSLRNAPPLGELLDGLIQLISAQQVGPAERVADKIGQLVLLLRDRRSLLILDNLETIMQAGAQAGQFRSGYEDYGTLMARLSQTQHQSCLLLTSREKPAELGPLEGRQAPVRTLSLRGLDESACQAVLGDRELFGTDAEWAALSQLYGGNPLALKLVSEPIREIFGGAIAAFLSAGDAFFNGVGQLLEAQFVRSTPLEQELLLWLAIERDLAPLDVLLVDLAGAASQREVLQSLESLRRRSLLERAEGRPAFSLQPVVQEFLTLRLVEAFSAELIDSRFKLLCSHSLLQAMAREYVRQSQARMLVMPVLEQLRTHYRSDLRLAAVLHERLDILRALPPKQQGYGGANLATLLAWFDGHLRGANLAGLALWNVSFAGLAMQDADLRGARFERAALTDTSDAFLDIAMSSDGQLLAAAMVNGIVRIWRAADLAPLANCIGHTAVAWTTAFRPGRISAAQPADLVLASGGLDGLVRLWSSDGMGVAALAGHQGSIWQVAWRPDGLVLASAGEDGTVRLWDVAGMQHTLLVSPDASAVYALAWHPDGLTLASGHADGSIRLWAAADRPAVAARSPAELHERALLRAHGGPVWALAWSPKGATLASGSADTTIRLWDERLQERAVLRGHTDLVVKLDWHCDGQLLASASADHSVRLWDAATSRIRAVIEGHSGSVAGVAFAPDGMALFSAGADQTVRVWDMPGGQPRATLVSYSPWTFGVAWGAGGLLASAGSDRVVQIWDVAELSDSGTPKPLLRASLVGHTNWIHSLTFSPDGRQLASGAVDGTVRLWDIAAGGARPVLRGREGFVTAAWSQDGQLLASGGANRTIIIWDASSGVPLRTLQGHADTVWSVAWSPGPGPAWLASAGNDRRIIVWDPASGALLRSLEGHTSFVRCVAWHPGGRLLASCGADGSVRLWDSADGRQLASNQEHTTDVRVVAWHPGGRLLASAGEDGTIRVWELSNRRDAVDQLTERAVLRCEMGQVRSVAWSPDGALLASGGEGGWVAVWDVGSAVAGGATVRLAQFRSDRPYERMRIGGASGLTDAQRATLLALGAVE